MAKRKAAVTPKPAKQRGKRKCKKPISSDDPTLISANDGVPATQSASVGTETSAAQKNTSPDAKMMPELTEAATAPCGEEPDLKERNFLDDIPETTQSEPEIQHPKGEASMSPPTKKDREEVSAQPAESTIEAPSTTCDTAPSPYKVEGPPEINPIKDTTYPPYVCPWNERTKFLDLDSATMKLKLLSFRIDEWVRAFCYSRTEGIEEVLSSEERQGILDHLGTYCLYKDWDTMLANLPRVSSWYLPGLLADALITKTLFDTMIRNPFFYVYGDDDDDTFRAAGHRPKFGQGLFQLARKLHRASAGYARRWTLITVRLLHAFSDNETNDGSIGIETGKWRDPIVQRLAADLLKPSSPLYLLLRKLDDPQRMEQRFRSLLGICRSAGMLSVSLGMNFESIDVRDQIKEYPPYCARDRSVRPCQDSMAWMPENADGRIPILIQRPEIKIQRYYWVPAEVMDWRGCLEWEEHPWETGCYGKVTLQKPDESTSDTSGADAHSCLESSEGREKEGGEIVAESHVE